MKNVLLISFLNDIKYHIILAKEQVRDEVQQICNENTNFLAIKEKINFQVTQALDELKDGFRRR